MLDGRFAPEAADQKRPLGRDQRSRRFCVIRIAIERRGGRDGGGTVHAYAAIVVSRISRKLRPEDPAPCPDGGQRPNLMARFDSALINGKPTLLSICFNSLTVRHFLLEVSKIEQRRIQCGFHTDSITAHHGIHR
jgi:hypothetical protein